MNFARESLSTTLEVVIVSRAPKCVHFKAHSVPAFTTFMSLNQSISGLIDIQVVLTYSQGHISSAKNRTFSDFATTAEIPRIFYCGEKKTFPPFCPVNVCQLLMSLHKRGRRDSSTLWSSPTIRIFFKETRKSSSKNLGHFKIQKLHSKKTRAQDLWFSTKFSGLHNQYSTGK